MPYASLKGYDFSAGEDRKIWRYLDFAKFVSLLDRRCLFFSRLDLLGDPYEGSVSRITVAKREEEYRRMQEAHDIPRMLIDDVLRRLPADTEVFRRFIFVNCWNMSDFESPALWSMYGGRSSVAIQSTYGRLRNCFEDNARRIYICPVRYLDYRTELVPAWNFFHPALHKRVGFEHEKELRAAFLNIPVTESSTGTPIDWEAARATPGHYIEIDVDMLVEAIYVAPTAPDWFLDLIGSVMGRLGYPHPTPLRSNLAIPPTF